MRSYVLNVVVLYITALLIEGFTYGNDYRILLFAALVFGVVNVIVRPLVKVLFLPVNILTLGLFSWMIDVILLYITTVVVDGVSITGFHFPGASVVGVTLGPATISTFAAYIVTALMISVVNRVVYWVLD